MDVKEDDDHSAIGNAIELIRLRKAYLASERKAFSRVWWEAIEVISGIDLTISTKEFVSIVGPSGCGKTTLLNIVGGLDRATSGTVLVDGQPVSGPVRGTAMVFQQVGLLPWKTVLQNVMFSQVLTYKRRTSQEERELARSTLEMVGLSDVYDAYPRELSGGMQQRVGIARALAVKPRLLLMDEPFGALDAQTRLSLQGQLLELLKEYRATVLFITHDVDEAIYLSDRVVVMGAAPGRIVGEYKVHIPKASRRGAEGTHSASVVQLGTLRAAILKDLGL